MKLYNYWRSSSSWRVRIALAFKGLEYEYIPVHLIKDGGEQHAQWFHEVNPTHQVPVLELPDAERPRYVGQSVAILSLLEDLHPDPPFLPSNPFERARAIQLAELVNSGIQPLQNLAVIQALKGHGIDAKAWCADVIERGLGAYEDLVAETAGDFSIGDTPTWADAFLVPQLYNARRFGVDVSAFPTVARIEGHCLYHPAFANSHPDQMPDAQT